jgi:hypothetical protein
MVYTVTWGALKANIEAPSEMDAWARFCMRHEEVQRRPEKHARYITEYVPEPEPPTPEPEL